MKEKINKLKYKDLLKKEDSDVFNLLIENSRMALELRLSSRKEYIKNFSSMKNVLKKNIAILKTRASEIKKNKELESISKALSDILKKDEVSLGEGK